MSLSKHTGRDNSQLFKMQDNFKKSFAKFNPSFVFCDNSVNVGIEVEVEKIGTNNSVLSSDTGDCYLWGSIEDGSLRNNGREYVSIPVKGQNIEFAVHTLHEFLNKNAKTKGHEFSDRTSVHVHVDCGDMSVNNIQSLVAVYMAVEPILYQFVGGDRSANIFAVPVNETIMYDDYLEYVLTHSDAGFGTIMDMARQWSKYTGLNLVPLRTYGTAEFRHMTGTADPLRLCNWINALLQIRKYAVTHDITSIYKRLSNMNTVSDYGAFINDVFYYDDTILRETHVDLVPLLEQTTSLLKSLEAPKALKGKHIKFDGSPFNKLGIAGKVDKKAGAFDYDSFRVLEVRPGHVAWARAPEPNQPALQWMDEAPIQEIVEFEEAPNVVEPFEQVLDVIRPEI
jgi:hypothetical protein